jgi:hypothetical protein
MIPVRLLNSLVRKWYELANEQTDKNQLYKDTNQLVEILAKIPKDKMVQAADILFKAFNKYDTDKSIQLGQWLGRHAFKSEKDSQAFQSFHRLSSTILKAKGLELHSPEAGNVSLIDECAIDQAAPPFDPTTASQLGQRWLTLTAQDEVSTDDRLALYTDTELLAAYLEAKQAADQDVSALAEALLNSFAQADPQRLTSWLSSHSFKRGSVITGACPSFHYLCSTLLESSFKESAQKESAQRLSSIDSNALQQIEQQKGNIFKDIADITELSALDKYPLKDLLAIRESSRENRAIVNKYLTCLMNYSYDLWKKVYDTVFACYDKKINFTNLEQLIKFFGKEALQQHNKLFLNQDTYVNGTVNQFNEIFKNLKILGLNILQPGQGLEDFKKLNISSLEELIVRSPKEDIFPLDFLQKTPNLSSVKLTNSCINAESLFYLQYCTKLKYLKLNNCNLLGDLENKWENLPIQLEEFFFSGSASINLKSFSKSKIKVLIFANVTFDENLSCIKNLSDLKELYLHNCISIEQLNALSDLPVEKLVIDSIDSPIEDASFLKSCSNLKELEFRRVTLSLKALSGTSIETLKLANSKITDYKNLKNIKNFSALSICECGPDLPEAKFVKGLPIKKVVISMGSISYTDFSCLEALQEVEELEICNCQNLITLEFLKKMPKLKVLKFVKNGVKLDVEFAKKCCPNLATITL